uniref:Uncharacterized protein n=1 Tax=Pristionchus pacificus TaxID=54126 RepID=A0A2A6CNF8_PRIPA|eukprot:PDM79636.1 hypothetical protein PRIPAC_32215 [Pristionchus pacificus]
MSSESAEGVPKSVLITRDEVSDEKKGLKTEVIPAELECEPDEEADDVVYEEESESDEEESDWATERGGTCIISIET